MRQRTDIISTPGSGLAARELRDTYFQTFGYVRNLNVFEPGRWSLCVGVTEPSTAHADEHAFQHSAMMDSNVRPVQEPDAALWVQLLSWHPQLPNACRMLLPEVFFGPLLLASMASDGTAHAILQPAQATLQADCISLAERLDRDSIDARTELEDRFMLTIAFRCPPWNARTNVKEVRYAQIEEKYSLLRARSAPMLGSPASAVSGPRAHTSLEKALFDPLCTQTL